MQKLFGVWLVELFNKTSNADGDMKMVRERSGLLMGNMQAQAADYVCDLLTSLGCLLTCIFMTYRNFMRS